MFGHISLIVEVHRNVLLVPKVAVRRAGSGEKIFILNERSAHARPVTTGFTTDHWAVVLDNVQEGEEVIVAGQDHLTDGSPVIVIRDGGVTEGGKR
jgi:multidrug efflux pump subunit AcrA (membrane-fusion protein)